MDKRDYQTLGAKTNDKVSYYADNYKQGDKVKAGGIEYTIERVQEDTKNMYICRNNDTGLVSCFHSIDLQKV